MLDTVGRKHTHFNLINPDCMDMERRGHVQDLKKKFAKDLKELTEEEFSIVYEIFNMPLKNLDNIHCNTPQEERWANSDRTELDFLKEEWGIEELTRGIMPIEPQR